MRNVSKMPYMVGAHWFQFVDQPAGGRWSDGEDGNNGIVNAKDQGNYYVNGQNRFKLLNILVYLFI